MFHRTSPSLRCFSLIATSLTLLLPGCGGPINPACEGDRPPRAALGDFHAVPSPRMGSIPFPGLVSLYADADPEKMGTHTYSNGTLLEGVGETGRGIVYTCRAGFLDIAHIRNTIDNAAYIHARLRWALGEGRDCVRYRLAEPSVWTVAIEYPDEWDTLDAGTRDELVRTAAARAAEALAFHSMSWHEVLTWYGYKSTGIISEKGSAFTYEDTPSHAVGAMVARRALAESEVSRASFGEAVSASLDDVLGELGAVPIERTREAIEKVEGEWWSGLGVDRRLIETPGEPIDPWLVEGVSGCEGATPIALEVPPLAPRGARTIRFHAEIDPRGLEASAILRDLREARGLEESPERVDLARDLPLLLERIRASYVEGGGPLAVRP